MRHVASLCIAAMYRRVMKSCIKWESGPAMRAYQAAGRLKTVSTNQTPSASRSTAKASSPDSG